MKNMKYSIFLVLFLGIANNKTCNFEYSKLQSVSIIVPLATDEETGEVNIA